ncbi:MAG: threonine ammonia-lyase [Verrucomicrobia bacterium]|nr:threonine ammonia-lyase [Verrucomicrobiota bacterium]
MAPVSFADIAVARERIAGAVLESPCPESIPLSEATGCTVFCKLENLQRTGSFKERGARNALLRLDPDQRRRGVIAASAGNHALGLAYHGGLLGIPVTVCMPEFAPMVKVSTCRRLGARVVAHGKDFAQARERADELAAAQGLAYIHGYDAPDIIAGQGTIGLEIVEQVPDFDAVVVPVGGGGLIAGIALAVKTLRPNVIVIGVEAEGATCFSEALAAGHPVRSVTRATLADGLATPDAGANAFEIARPLIDRIAVVNEDDIALAILRIVELEKLVVEGAGATGLAALLAGKLPELAGKRVVLPFCGGNIDPVILSRVIEKGLVADGRIARFQAIISDRPGGLAGLTKLLAEAGASVQQIEHERAFAGGDVYAVRVLCTVETRGRDHLTDIFARLQREGIRVCDQSP